LLVADFQPSQSADSPARGKATSVVGGGGGGGDIIVNINISIGATRFAVCSGATKPRAPPC
jgi:hypothetical protein